MEGEVEARGEDGRRSRGERERNSEEIGKMKR